jgi:hypothetical protein
MGVAMAVAIGCLWLTIKFGPEERAKFLSSLKPNPCSSLHEDEAATEAGRNGLENRGPGLPFVGAQPACW